MLDIVQKMRILMFISRKFTIKEIDIGMAADLGTLQLLPNIIGN